MFHFEAALVTFEAAFVTFEARLCHIWGCLCHIWGCLCHIWGAPLSYLRLIYGIYYTQGSKEDAEATDQGPDVVVVGESVDNDVDVGIIVVDVVGVVHQGASDGRNDRIWKREILKI